MKLVLTFWTPSMFVKKMRHEKILFGVSTQWITKPSHKHVRSYVFSGVLTSLVVRCCHLNPHYFNFNFEHAPWICLNTHYLTTHYHITFILTISQKYLSECHIVVYQVRRERDGHINRDGGERLFAARVCPSKCFRFAL